MTGVGKLQAFVLARARRSPRRRRAGCPAGPRGEPTGEVDGAPVEVAAAGDGVTVGDARAEAGKAAVLLPREARPGRAGPRGAAPGRARPASPRRRSASPAGPGRRRLGGEPREAPRDLADSSGASCSPSLVKSTRSAKEMVASSRRGRGRCGGPDVEGGMAELLAEMQRVEVLERGADRGTSARVTASSRSASAISSLSPRSRRPRRRRRLAEHGAGDHLAVRGGDLRQRHRHHPRRLLDVIGRDPGVEQLPHPLAASRSALVRLRSSGSTDDHPERRPLGVEHLERDPDALGDLARRVALAAAPARARPASSARRPPAIASRSSSVRAPPSCRRTQQASAGRSRSSPSTPSSRPSASGIEVGHRRALCPQRVAAAARRADPG